MYSFRYHLVTICSILVALALGLLLGAALATSDLVQETSGEMVDSILSRYETLDAANEKLTEEVQNNTTLASDLTKEWSEERFEGRTIVLMFGNNNEDEALSATLTEAITYAGGSVVNVTVEREDFGLGDSEIKSALLGIVKQVPDEDYQQTLAHRLVEEWSYHYSASSVSPVEEDFSLEPYDYAQPTLVSPEGAQSGAALNNGETLTTETEFQDLFNNRYALTRKLLSLGIISIATDYSSLQEHKEPETPTEQLAALSVATAWQLPYGMNGFVNGFAPGNNDVTQQAQMGIQITLSVQAAAADGRLHYPSWLKTSIPRDVGDESSQPNYHALLVQSSNTSFAMDVIAESNELSCVTTPTTTSGRYSVLALLSGAEAGIYGEDRPPNYRFAPLPEDPTGRAVFR